MPCLKIPEYIFAVGGAGKKIVLHMLQKEWVLKEILKPDSNPNDCKVIIVDTAIDEENTDKESIKRFREKKDKIRSEYIRELEKNRIQDIKVGNLEIDYQLISKSLQLISPADLIGEVVKNKILSSTDASCYWLNDDKISNDWHIKIMNKENLQNLNFAKGVYRKRAIGKAIYYKALAERVFVVDNLKPSSIAIICGFGGGTGSGIALDLAKEIKVNKQTSNITLFGVLSTLNESEDEKANCCGMLSELEYIKVSDKNLQKSREKNSSNINKNNLNQPNAENDIRSDAESDIAILERNIFENIILLPIEATNYGGEMSSDPGTKEFLLQFDDAFPYSLIAYYNMNSQLFFDNPSFAPFTIAIPQQIRFNIDQIRKIKEEISKKKRCKEISLESESKIYEMFDNFIKKYSNVKSNQELTDEDKLKIYNDRFNKFKKILESKYFTELNYSSILKLKKLLNTVNNNFKENFENKTVYKKVEQLIDTLKNEIDGQAINMTESPGQTDLDSSLLKMLIDDIKMIRKQIEILRYINSIEDLYIKNILKPIIRLDEEGLGNSLTKIDVKLNEISRDRNDEESLKSEKIAHKNKLISEVENSIESENKGFKVKYSAKYAELIGLEGNFEKLQSNFNILNRELKNFVNNVNRLDNSQVDSISIELISETIKAIDSIIEKGNLQLGFNGQEIRNTVLKIKSLRKAIIDSNLDIPRFDSLIEYISTRKTRSGIIKDNGRSNRNSIIKELEFNEKLKVNINSNEEIEIDYTFDIDAKIYELKTKIIKNICSEVKDNFKNAELSLFEELEENLADANSRNSITLEHIVKSNARFDNNFNKLEKELLDCENKISNLDKKINVYNDLRTLIQEISLDYKKHSESLEKYHLFMLGNELQESMDISRRDENAKYVYEMQPRDIYQVLALNKDIRTIVENYFDRADLVTNIKKFLDKTISAKYNILVSNTIGNTLRQWEYTKMGVCLISKVNHTEVRNSVYDHVNSLKANFGVHVSQNLNLWSLENGDDWGVGLVTFISSVPLDNVRNFVLPDGFFSAYQKRKYSSDKMSFFHSAYMMQRAKLIWRKQTYDIKNKNKDLFLITSEDEAKLRGIIYSNIEEEDLSNYAKNIQ